MTQPKLNDDDVFHIIGFTNQDVLSGTHLRVVQRLGMPVRPSGTTLSEVYFLDSVSAPDPDAFVLYGDYLAVYFFNDAALLLAREAGIKLPPVMAKTTRAKLPTGVGTSVRMPA
jgi:hypothetical protein